MYMMQRFLIIREQEELCANKFELKMENFLEKYVIKTDSVRILSRSLCVFKYTIDFDFLVLYSGILYL